VQIKNRLSNPRAARISAISLLLLTSASVVSCRAQAQIVIGVTTAFEQTKQAPPAEDGQTPATHFSHVAFTPPAGWTRTVAGGWLQFSPPDVPPGQSVAIQVSPGGPSNRDLAEEFAALVKVSANGMTTVEKKDPQFATDRQGLKTIRQVVVLQDARGAKHLQMYIARRNGDRFEAMAYTTSSLELATKYLPALQTFVSSMVFDGAPPPQPVPPATPTGGQHPTQGAAPQVAPAAVTPQPSAPPVRLQSLAARPNYIIGRAVFENGQPIPKFHVTMAGMSGKFDPFFNNQLSGPQLREGSTSHGSTDGENGRYAIHATEDATVTGVYARAIVHFDNADWGIVAWPTDNIADGSSGITNNLYRGHTGKGVVRDFVLKLSGLRNGFDPAKFPDHDNSGRDWGAYYGGTIRFECGADNNDNPGGVIGLMHTRPVLTMVYPAGSIITVTLTPTGTRVDGLPASTITRKCPIYPSFNLYGIPYAIYTATATLTDPAGAVHNLKVTTQPLLSKPPWGRSAPARWEPWANREPIGITLGLAAE
jgi:hypothetical protein